MEFGRTDVRKLIYFFWKRGLSPNDISKEINSTLGSQTTNERTCRRWVSQFKEGDFSTSDKDRSGRPPIAFERQIQELLDSNKYATSRNIAGELNVSHQTVLNHLKSMGKRYLSNRWIPHVLNEEQKSNRMRICNELLNKYSQNDFLGQLVTMDEVWIYWCNNEGSYHHKSWRGEGDVPQVEVQRRLTTRKHLLSVFWDCKGVIHMEILPSGKTLNSDIYCQQLDNLKVAIQNERRRLIGEGFHQIHYLHDNAKPHVASKTVAKLSDIGFTVLPHPAYSPDLAPSDFYLFSPMKSSVRNKTFDSADDIMKTINKWIASKPRKFFADGIQKLPGRWKRCVDHNGDYFEHLIDHDIE